MFVWWGCDGFARAPSAVVSDSPFQALKVGFVWFRERSERSSKIEIAV